MVLMISKRLERSTNQVTFQQHHTLRRMHEL
jgi:hypothetical protein